MKLYKFINIDMLVKKGKKYEIALTKEDVAIVFPRIHKAVNLPTGEIWIDKTLLINPTRFITRIVGDCSYANKK